VEADCCQMTPRSFLEVAKVVGGQAYIAVEGTPEFLATCERLKDRLERLMLR
jgi:hypothetical protein